MTAFLADVNFDGNIVRGVKRKRPEADILRAQDVGLSEADDPALLEWAAHEKRVLLTHDVRTVTKYAYERLAAGLPTSGVFEVPRFLAIGVVIEELLLIIDVSQEGEWEGRIEFLPL